MTISETRKLLTILWSLFPNAPKLSSTDKAGTAFAWFMMLHEFAIRDIWTAAQTCMKEQPKFPPTAPEIKAKAEKTLDVERHLPEGFSEAARAVDFHLRHGNSEGRFYAILSYGRCLKFLSETEELSELEKKSFDEYKKALWVDMAHDKALQAAHKDYDDFERQKILAEEESREALRSLGFLQAEKTAAFPKDL